MLLLLNSFLKHIYKRIEKNDNKNLYPELSNTESACAVIILLSEVCLSVWLYHTFSHISYRVRFLENLLNVKCMFWFSLQLLSTTLPTVRRTELNPVTNEQMSSHKIPIIILVRLEWNWNFLNQFLKNILKYEISWKPVKWQSICSMQTDGHDDTNSCFSQFCEHA
jgi:hypothetical protein